MASMGVFHVAFELTTINPSSMAHPGHVATWSLVSFLLELCVKVVVHPDFEAAGGRKRVRYIFAAH